MDMLVKLYELKDDPALKEKLAGEGILIKRAMTPNLTKIAAWVKEQFGQGWADECTAGILNNGCWIAVKDHQIVGFACFDATLPDFFGPTGVAEEMRGRGIGKALLLRCLISMKEKGYAYAIIGGAGPTELYKRWVNATPIENTAMGIYEGILPNP